MNVSPISNNLKYSNMQNQNPSFGKKSILASGLAKIIESNKFGKLVDATSNSKVDIVKHLSAANGLLISGLYVKNTLTNDKLDPAKKKTLAINQAIVSLLATTLGYTFDKLAYGWIDKFTDKFRAANLKTLGKEAPAKLGTFTGGIKAATSMLIFTTVYRYISPVIVTPVANRIGNYLENKNKSKEAKTV